MQTRSRHLPHSLAAATLLVILIAGCAARSRTPTQEADAYKALMVSYRDQMLMLTARPLPPASMPKEQRRAVLAQQLDYVADANKQYQTRLDALQMPTALEETQRVSADLLGIVADNTYRSADEMRHGTSKAQARSDREGEIRYKAAFKHFQQVSQALKVEAVKGH